MSEDKDKPPTRKKYSYEEDKKYSKSWDDKDVLSSWYISEQTKGLSGPERQRKLSALRKLYKEGLKKQREED